MIRCNPMRPQEFRTLHEVSFVGAAAWLFFISGMVSAWYGRSKGMVSARYERSKGMMSAWYGRGKGMVSAWLRACPHLSHLPCPPSLRSVS